MEFSYLGLLVALYFAIFAPLVSAGKVTKPNNVPKNAILLSKVESLTFRNGKMTTARRVSPVPQLNCVGPKNICKLFNVEVMRCTNEGADYEAENIQWACRADLPEEFKLGGTDVSCEGYASSDDPYVLKGSCGVDYRLLLTEKGEQKFGGGWRGSNPSEDFGEGGSSTIARVIFFLIFGGVLVTIIFKMLQACGHNPPRLGGGNTRPPWYGGGGGGDDDDDSDLPPPYDSHTFNQPRKPKTYGTSSTTSTAGSSRTAGQQQNQAWRPGPWTAAAAGAGLAYAFGRNQNRTQTQPRQPAQRPSRGIFGGGGSYDGGAGPSNARSSSSSSFSSTRHESTGFGGTSRR